MAGLFDIVATDPLERMPDVYWRDTFEDGWQQLHYAAVGSVSLTTGNAIGRADVFWEYGNIQQPGTIAFAAYQPQSLLGKQLRISWVADAGNANYDFAVADQNARLALTDLAIGQRVFQIDTEKIWIFDGPIGGEAIPGNWSVTTDEPELLLSHWYGIVTDATDERFGNGAGNQRIIAHSLGEWLLTRKQITTSVVTDVAGVSTKEIKRGLAFNGWRSDYRAGITREFGNQSNIPAVDGTQVFARTLDNPRKWNAADIIRYLARYQMPAGADWELSTDDDNVIAWYEPINVQTHGRTVFQVLNQIIDRSRAMTWTLDFDDEQNLFTIRLHSYADTDLDLPGSSASLPANANQVYADLRDNRWVVSLSVDSSFQNRYSYVIVEGARRGSVVSLGLEDETLAADWSPEQRAEYDTAASNEVTYPGSLSERKQMNDLRRMKDDLSEVFTTFAIPSDWNGEAGSGDGLEPLVIAHLAVDSQADPIVPDELEPFWYSGLRCENYLPILEGHEYSTPEEPTSTVPAERPAQLKRPFATISISRLPSPLPIREFVTDLSSASILEGFTGAGLPFNCRLRMLDHRPGFVAMPNVPSHVMGLDDFDPAIAAPSDFRPYVNFTTIACTSYLTFDDRLRVWHPAIPEDDPHLEPLIIRLGDRGHLDYMPKGTVYDVPNGLTAVSEDSGFVRDDRPLLKDIARTAWQWYQVDRQQFQLRVGLIYGGLNVGDLVTRLAVGESLNTLVTHILYDFERFQTIIQSDYAELSPGSLIRA